MSVVCWCHSSNPKAADPKSPAIDAVLRVPGYCKQDSSNLSSCTCSKCIKKRARADGCRGPCLQSDKRRKHSACLAASHLQLHTHIGVLYSWVMIRARCICLAGSEPAAFVWLGQSLLHLYGWIKARCICMAGPESAALYGEFRAHCFGVAGSGHAAFAPSCLTTTQSQGDTAEQSLQCLSLICRQSLGQSNECYHKGLVTAPFGMALMSLHTLQTCNC